MPEKSAKSLKNYLNGEGLLYALAVSIFIHFALAAVMLVIIAAVVGLIIKGKKAKK